MSTLTMKAVAAYFDSKDLKYTYNDEKNFIRLGMNIDIKGSMEILLIFDDDRTMALKSYNYLSFPEDKKQLMYAVCSKVNADYRWVKFYVDESDNTITVEDDAVLDISSAGDEAFELCLRMFDIGQKAYTTFMKALLA